MYVWLSHVCSASWGWNSKIPEFHYLMVMSHHGAGNPTQVSGKADSALHTELSLQPYHTWESGNVQNTKLLPPKQTNKWVSVKNTFCDSHVQFPRPALSNNSHIPWPVMSNPHISNQLYPIPTSRDQLCPIPTSCDQSCPIPTLVTSRVQWKSKWVIVLQ